MTTIKYTLKRAYLVEIPRNSEILLFYNKLKFNKLILIKKNIHFFGAKVDKIICIICKFAPN